MNRSESRGWGALAALLMVIAMLIFAGTMVAAGQHGDNIMPFVGLVAGVILFAVVWLGPVGRALARMIDGRASDDQQGARIELIESQLLEWTGEHQRIAELEERLDFAERMLTQRDSVRAISNRASE